MIQANKFSAMTVGIALALSLSAFTPSLTVAQQVAAPQNPSPAPLVRPRVIATPSPSPTSGTVTPAPPVVLPRANTPAAAQPVATPVISPNVTSTTTPVYTAVPYFVPAQPIKPLAPSKIGERVEEAKRSLRTRPQLTAYGLRPSTSLVTLAALDPES